MGPDAIILGLSYPICKMRSMGNICIPQTVFWISSPSEVPTEVTLTPTDFFATGLLRAFRHVHCDFPRVMQDVLGNKGMLFSSPATNMGWPNSSFGLFHTILCKNLNKLFFFATVYHSTQFGKCPVISRKPFVSFPAE